MDIPNLSLIDDWETIFQTDAKADLEKILPGYLRTQRWFGGKARRIASVEVEDSVRISYGSTSAHMAFVRVNYGEGSPDTYALPLVSVSGAEADKIRSENRNSILARMTSGDSAALLVNAMQVQEFCRVLLDAIAGSKIFRSPTGAEVRGVPSRVLGRLAGRDASRLVPSLGRAEQSNSSVLYGNRLILKVFRRLSEGINPDLEVGAFLTEAGYAHIPPVGGSLEYRKATGELITLGILQAFVRNLGDAWSFTLKALSEYYERVKSMAQTPEPEALPEARGLIGNYLAAVELLGRRTAELHLALASDKKNPDFAPEPFSAAYQRLLHQSIQDLAIQTFQLLDERMPELPEAIKGEAGRVRSLEAQVLDRFRWILDREINGLRTRVHGDYHLGQVLYTGNDFVIIDFEGEPARPISERRIKRSPLRDVAGMLRSFHYAAYGALRDRAAASPAEGGGLAEMESWANSWYAVVSTAFMNAYLAVAGQAEFLPQDREELTALLEVYELEKAIYEMAYELNNRPDWLRIPVRGVLQVLGRYE